MRLTSWIAAGAILALVVTTPITVVLLLGKDRQTAENEMPTNRIVVPSRQSNIDARVGATSNDRSKTYPTANESGIAARFGATAVAATVEVVDRARGIAGSGVVIGVAGPLVYVLTANHLVSNAETLEIHVLDNRSSDRKTIILSCPEVIAASAETDLALLRIQSLRWRPSALHVCSPNLAPRDAGFSVLVTAWTDEEKPTFRVAEVECRRQVRKSPGSDPVWVWQVSAAQERGASGGAMVGPEGCLLGIASGVNDGKGYFADTECIQRFLRQNGLKWLYEERPVDIPRRAP